MWYRHTRVTGPAARADARGDLLLSHQRTPRNPKEVDNDAKQPVRRQEPPEATIPSHSATPIRPCWSGGDVRFVTRSTVEHEESAAKLPRRAAQEEAELVVGDQRYARQVLVTPDALGPSSRPYAVPPLLCRPFGDDERGGRIPPLDVAGSRFSGAAFGRSAPRPL